MRTNDKCTMYMDLLIKEESDLNKLFSLINVIHVLLVECIRMLLSSEILVFKVVCLILF